MRTYRNPVHPHSFPDPFVLKFRGEYWAYCTGFWEDGRCFGILRSRDLVSWEPQAGALAPLPGGFPCYWAPEVVYDNGRFYLYYSVGNEERMEIRVAVADHAGGPFEDSGHRLTSEPFAIDAHVFTDPDAASGARYLFYATDFLDHTHIGTGTVMDRLLDPFTLEGAPRPVSRPRFDWHVYHPNRPEKGGVRWYTVEGSFVLERKGLYYQMFSGGNWQNPTYGVSYAVTDRLDRPGEWTQAADGVRVLPVMRSGGEVVGPGHNSVVRGPDNRQLYCVYHRWSADTSARVMAIDPLDWAGERLLVLGPSTTEQPAPPRPTLEDLADQTLSAGTEAVRPTGGPSFLVEVSLCALENLHADGGAGVALRSAGGESLRFLLGSEFRIRRKSGEERLALPSGFDPRAFHLVRIEVDGTRVAVDLDGVTLRWRGEIEAPAEQIALLADGVAATFSGFALTLGWEDLFLDGGRLALKAPAAFSRGPAFRDYLMVVNVRAQREGSYAVSPAVADDDPGPRVTLVPIGEGWGLSAGEALLPLPERFDPFVDQQLRFHKRGGRVGIEWEGEPVGEVAAPAGPAHVALAAARGEVSFEAVRVSAIAAG
ncbi:MAG TPA: glycoside hydrolase family 43 protein [Thermoanaerobaculia bacterium]|nr:glycoside hydrolase family 43 protein [Thermoanaerobaculia bacterium]